MPAAKGMNRFESFQKQKQENRGALISEFLAYLKTSRVRHQYVTDLAEMVAKHISEREGKPCNRATLLRNPRYKASLLSYMAENHAAGTNNLKVRSISDPKAQAMVMTAQVDASNYKRENERLRAHIAYLDSKGTNAPRQIGSIAQNEPGNLQFELEQAKLQFVRACQTLQSVLKYLGPIVLVDTSGKQIVDRSKSRNNVIVGSEIAAGFFEWLEANSGIGKIGSFE